ncbi:hypothetical protein RchiOBHm_Chr1g0326121 [Rosa chinensis]|uniref:Uncharacterized protein n=1 Tax=Rosa chinensis TaxID=74649 RepID=A0A2P6SA82_ROSCH|nr:hypothetical protein RchiOBHm_Chr1g0326121 [Rosa chinensis]
MFWNSGSAASRVPDEEDSGLSRSMSLRIVVALRLSCRVKNHARMIPGGLC